MFHGENQTRSGGIIFHVISYEVFKLSENEVLRLVLGGMKCSRPWVTLELFSSSYLQLNHNSFPGGCFVCRTFKFFLFEAIEWQNSSIIKLTPEVLILHVSNGNCHVYLCSNIGFYWRLFKFPLNSQSFFFYIIYLLWIKPLKWHITGRRSVSCLKWLWGSHLPLWYFSGSSTYICWVLLLKTNAVEPVYKELDSSVKSGRCLASLLYSCKPIFRTWRGPKKSLKHWTVRKVRSAKKIKFITFRAT